MCFFFKLWGLFRVIGYIGIQNIGPFYYILLENHYMNMGYGIFLPKLFGTGILVPHQSHKIIYQRYANKYLCVTSAYEEAVSCFKNQPWKIIFLCTYFKNIRMSCHILLYNCPHNVLSYIITVRLCMLYLFWQIIFLFLWL